MRNGNDSGDPPGRSASIGFDVKDESTRPRLRIATPSSGTVRDVIWAGSSAGGRMSRNFSGAVTTTLIALRIAGPFRSSNVRTSRTP